MGTQKDIMEQGASLVVRWKAEEGWPIQFMSKGISMFGYTQQEFSSGKVTWNDFTCPEDIPRVKKELAEHLRLGNDEFDQEYRVRTKSGELRWVLDKTVVIKEDGKVANLHSVLVDITSIKDREESRTKHTEGLEEIRKSLCKANKILSLQSKVIDCLCGYSNSLNFQDILKLMCAEMKLNSIFVYLCNSKGVDQLAGWTKPNGNGEWAMPKIIDLDHDKVVGIRKWVQSHAFSFEAMSCLPDELQFMACDESLRNMTNVAVVGVKIAEKPWGIVCFGTHNQKMWREEELEALSSLGRMIALVAQKYRNQEIIEREIESRIGQIQEVMQRINGVEYARSP